jgi:hypothetical protein
MAATEEHSAPVSKARAEADRMVRDESMVVRCVCRVACLHEGSGYRSSSRSRGEGAGGSSCMGP